jgi:hypothetical protein
MLGLIKLNDNAEKSSGSLTAERVRSYGPRRARIGGVSEHVSFARRRARDVMPIWDLQSSTVQLPKPCNDLLPKACNDLFCSWHDRCGLSRLVRRNRDYIGLA